MELRRYLRVLRRHSLLLVVAAVVAVGVAYTTTSRVARYTTTATLYVGSRSVDLDTAQGQADVSLNRIQALSGFMLTFSTMIDSRPVAVAALQQAGVSRSPESLVAGLVAAPVTGTQLLTISVTDFDPVMAATLANATAEAFVALVTQLESATAAPTADGAAIPTGIPIAVFERASIPGQPLPIGLLNRMVVFALLGVLLTAAAVFAVEYLDVTLHNAEDTERRLGMPVLGVVPLLRDDPARMLVAAVEQRAAPRREVADGVA